MTKIKVETQDSKKTELTFANLKHGEMGIITYKGLWNGSLVMKFDNKDPNSMDSVYDYITIGNEPSGKPYIGNLFGQNYEHLPVRRVKSATIIVELE